MHPGGGSPAGPRTTILVALLAATVLFASLLAWEAHYAARAARVTAARALREQASVAAWELSSAARERRDVALARMFGAVTSAPATSPFEVLPPVNGIRESAAVELGCASSESQPFRVDFRSGAVEGTSPLRRPTAAVLGDAARQFVRTHASPERPLGVQRVPWQGGERAVAMASRYARLGGPVAVYGVVLCESALGAAFFRELIAQHPLAPAAVNGRPNDSLFAVTILASPIDTVLVTDRSGDTEYRAESLLPGWDGWRATVAVRPGAVEALLIGGRGRSRAPLLIGLTLLSAGLAVVAVLQLRREHELARLRADFIAGVSHELRTPLAQILLFGETLALGRARSEVERRRAIDTIIHEARRLMHMVDNVLLFGRDRRRSSGIPPAPVALAPVVAAVVAGFDPLARAAGVRLETAVPDDLMALADAGSIRQILLNLLDNAVKYGPSGQTVRVEALADGEQLLLAVEDEGAGIPVTDRERIWTPWVRLSRESGSTRAGSGIGLSVVRELAESLGGAATVRSGARGGARFEIRLPLAGGGGRAEPQAAALAAANGARP